MMFSETSSKLVIMTPINRVNKHPYTVVPCCLYMTGPIPDTVKFQSRDSPTNPYVCVKVMPLTG